MAINPNSPAFPCLDSSGAGLSLREPGLTIRAEIATRALQGLLADPTCSANHSSVAVAAVMYADALIAELNKE